MIARVGRDLMVERALINGFVGVRAVVELERVAVAPPVVRQPVKRTERDSSCWIEIDELNSLELRFDR